MASATGSSGRGCFVSSPEDKGGQPARAGHELMITGMELPQTAAVCRSGRKMLRPCLVPYLKFFRPSHQILDTCMEH